MYNYPSRTLVPRRPSPQLMGCRCDGLNGLMGAVGNVNDPVRQGAPFAVCVEFTDYYAQWWPASLSDTMQAISTAIQNSGATQGLVRTYQLAGIVDPFVCVEGQTGRDYNHGYDLRDGVLAVMASQYSGINYGTVRFQVTTYDPSTGQTQESRTDTPEGSGPPPAPPGAGIFDQIAEALSVTRDESMLLLGGAALLLVMLIKR